MQIDRFIEIIRAMHELDQKREIVVRVTRGKHVSDMTLTETGISEESWTPSLGPISHSGMMLDDSEPAASVAERIMR